jgi:hypothetical protein
LEGKQAQQRQKKKALRHFCGRQTFVWIKFSDFGWRLPGPGQRLLAEQSWRVPSGHEEMHRPDTSTSTSFWNEGKLYYDVIL